MKTIGNRAEVMAGKAKMTSGGLKKSDLFVKDGMIKSRRASMAAKAKGRPAGRPMRGRGAVPAGSGLSSNLSGAGAVLAGSGLSSNLSGAGAVLAGSQVRGAIRMQTRKAIKPKSTSRRAIELASVRSSAPIRGAIKMQQAKARKEPLRRPVPRSMKVRKVSTF